MFMMMSLSDGFSIRSSNAVCDSQHVLLAYLYYITQCHKDQVFLSESNYLVPKFITPQDSLPSQLFHAKLSKKDWFAFNHNTMQSQGSK